MQVSAQPLVVTTVVTAHRIEIASVTMTVESQGLGRAVASVDQTVVIKPA